MQESISFTQLEAADLLLERSDLLLTDTTLEGINCLHLAARKSSDFPEGILYVLERGGKDLPIDILNRNGETPLLEAVRSANMKCIEILLEKGASLLADGLVHAAAEANQLEVLDLLISKGASYCTLSKSGMLPLHAAVLEGSDAAVEKILDLHPEQISSVTERKQTPLHLAAKRALMTTISLLLARGAALDLKDSIGNTPLHLACASGSASAVAVLFEAGADAGAMNEQGLAPFELVTHNDVAAYAFSHEFPAAQIQTLDISYTSLVILPQSKGYWASLKKLETLDARGNLFSSLPIGMLAAPALVNVWLQNNPLQDIPSSTKRQNCQWKDIRAYLSTLQKDSVRWNEKKLFIIGDEGAGK